MQPSFGAFGMPSITPVLIKDWPFFCRKHYQHAFLVRKFGMTSSSVLIEDWPFFCRRHYQHAALVQSFWHAKQYILSFVCVLGLSCAESTTNERPITRSYGKLARSHWSCAETHRCSEWHLKQYTRFLLPACMVAHASTNFRLGLQTTTSTPPQPRNWSRK